MKIIQGDYKYKSHAWDEKVVRDRWAICGIYIYDTKSDVVATEVTCRTCLRLLAARGLDYKLREIGGA